jgi:hypothetical protein
MLPTDINIPRLPAPWGTVGSAVAYDDDDTMNWAQRAVHSLSMFGIPLGSVITLGKVAEGFPAHILPPEVEVERLIIVTWYTPGVNDVCEFVIWMSEAGEKLPTIRRVESVALTFAGTMAGKHESGPDIFTGPVAGVIGVDRSANLCQVIFGEQGGHAGPVSILGTPFGDGPPEQEAGPVLDGGPYNAMRRMVGLPVANTFN